MSGVQFPGLKILKDHPLAKLVIWEFWCIYLPIRLKNIRQAKPKTMAIHVIWEIYDALLRFTLYALIPTCWTELGKPPPEPRIIAHDRVEHDQG